MANEPLITVVGNLTDDPELRFTPAGAAVANFTLASTPRVQNGDQWEDGETLWLRCAAWRQLGENVAESLRKGNQVIVQGRLRARTYEHNGETRTSMDLNVDHIGPSLQWATAAVTKASRQGGSGRQGGGQHTSRPQSAPAGDPWGAPQGQDPWA